MRTEYFRDYCESLPDADDRERRAEAVREQLEASTRRWYFDESGDGTRYVTSGTRHGVGFARATVEVLPDGRAQVVVRTGQRVNPSLERDLRKLFSHYSSKFKVRGLEVEEGQVVFRTQPFDPTSFRFDTDRVVSLALSTVHAYAGVTLSLDAGVEPWELVDYFEDSDLDGPDDDGGLPIGEVDGRALFDLAREMGERLSQGADRADEALCE